MLRRSKERTLLEIEMLKMPGEMTATYGSLLTMESD